MVRGDEHERCKTASKTDDHRLESESQNLEAIRLVNENDKIGRIQSVKASDTDEDSRRTRSGFRRYRNALENVIPLRRENKRGGKHPVDEAGLFSFTLYSWLSKYLYRAYKKGFDPREWPALSPFDGCDLNAERLEILWRDELSEKGVRNASLKKVVWRFIRTRFIVAFLLFALCNICGFLTQTLIMQKLLEHMQLLESTYEDGLKWAALLIVGELTRWFLLSVTSVLIYRSATRLKLACMILLYRHVIRINHLGDTNCGELVNLFTNDSQKIFDMVTFGPLIIGGIILTVCGIWYILRLLGTMALLGMLVFLVYFPFQYGISRLAGYLSSKTVKSTDSRMRLTNEILDSIKLIKLYAWEKRFSENLFDVRKKELNYVFASDCCTNTNFAMAQTLPVVATIVTFLLHLSTGEGLMSAQAFPVATFFTSQMTPMLFRVRDSLQAFIDCSIALGRFKRVLTIEDESIIVSKPILKTQAIVISRGKFSYKSTINLKEKQASDVNSVERKNTTASSGQEDEEEKLNEVTEAKIVHVLFDITFEATRGKLVGICGHVGSGKSSLLLAALGQLRATEGQVMRDGSCAYVSQQAWITNATLKDNVLFGERFDADRYSRALHVCNLSYDIETMPGGDQTEIGERGVNLSGGQKQRVALARALYADRDIYFLDDPLSAVDAHVGLHIFNHLITGALRGKTVLFVTHQIQYLNRCDDIYMMRHGRIAEHGTHDDLMKLDQEYAAMVHSISSEDTPPATNNITTTGTVETKEQTNEILDNDIQAPSSSDRKSSSPRVKNEDDVKETKTTLIQAEKSEEGTIKGETYLCYVRAAGGWIAVFLTVLLTSFYCGSFSFSSWWLAAWLRAGGGNKTDPKTNATKLSDNINDNPNFSYYRTIYAATLGLILASSLIRSFVYCKLTNRAARKLHNDLFNKIMSSPMRFFETTPAGRIQNLFTRDMDEVDNKLPTGVNFIIIYILQIVIAILLISMVFPWFIVPVCMLTSGMLYFIYQIYRVSLRGLKRMESTTRSPVLGHVTATVQGLDTIHAFEKEEDFKSRFNELVEENNKYYFLVVIVSRWLGVRVDGLVTLMPCTVALLVAILKGLVPPALAGLALSYSVFISNILQYIIRVMSDVETRFVSVERIHRYINLPETEGDNGKPPSLVKSDWPDAAVLRFQNVCMSYGKDTALVLNGVSFRVERREKIGIVGRTGSGKSSLTVALFRLVELSGGKITIDDTDISEVGLERLRSRLSIIPQEPILFSGTIRSNLDPFKTNSDSEIWEALEKTKLKGRVQSIAGQLDATVGLGGDNLSVGERQLLCLARALLRHTKILVLDEATAAVDPETETVVQNTIQQAFVDSTVLTIAHRLQTVVTCDRILVMDDGKVAEFDTPSNLLANEDSQFSRMMKAARKVTTQ